MSKLKVLYHSDNSLAKTGFGRVSKALLSYLYKTGKYDIVHYCCGTHEAHPDLIRTPWKSVGCLPADQNTINELNKDPHIARQASYGSHLLDRTIEQEKPDVYIGTQDIWGVDYAIDKPWFDKINSVIWTTLDSLPILPSAVEAAKKVENLWVWSNFAEKELHKMGCPKVKTMHGCIDAGPFYKYDDQKKAQLRKKFNICQDEFIVGFVFRNQLRKSVPNLMEGFSKFKKRTTSKAKLLLHTHFSEGWDISRLMQQYEIKQEDILTTYVCRDCKNYFVHSFVGQDKECPLCKSGKGLVTTHTGFGVTENQLADVYNLMDVYCHPFTSGGQEIPIQEAKLCELITLVTNYSCGEEMCEPEASSIPLEWSKYTEHGTQFIKASTYPESIYKQLTKVYNLDKAKKEAKGKDARQWVLDNFSSESVGKKFEDFLDSCKKVNYDFSLQKQGRKNPNAEVKQISDNSEWLINLYKDILDMRVDQNDEGHKHWMTQLSRGITRETIVDFFRKTAQEEINKNKTINFEDLLDKSDQGKRILYVMPESIGDVYMSTALFKNIKNLYPDHNLYVATKTQYHQILDGNPYVHKVIPFIEQMNNLLWLEGHGEHNGYFKVAYLPHIGTQKIFDYQHNGKDKIQFDLCTY
jgi:glycosyltransferase involved in cell wall biosynthesis